MLDAYPNFAGVSVYGVGFDEVVVAVRFARNCLSRYTDMLTNDGADPGVAMVLALSRGMIGASQWVRDGSGRDHHAAGFGGRYDPAKDDDHRPKRRCADPFAFIPIFKSGAV